MKTVVFIIVAVLILAALPGFADGKTSGASRDVVIFDKWGFKIEIPGPFEKHVMPSRPGEKLSETYITGGLAYFVKITDIPPDSLTSTAVEQMLQAEMKRGSLTGRAKRWERNSSFEELFKGISAQTKLDLKAAPWLRKILGGDTGFVSDSMAPLSDESSPILTVGIIGPSERAAEIENMAEFLVSTVSKFKAKPASNAPAAPARKTPPPAKSDADARLGADDIELFGAVDKIGPEEGSLTMMVDHVRLPKEGIVRFDHPRAKVVICKKMPAGIAVGARLRVVGKNAGVGKPLSADTIRVE